MKTKIFLLLAIFCITVSAQETNQLSSFSIFNFGILSGINYSNHYGASVLIEGKTNLSSNLNVKLALGYSTVNKAEGYNVKTNSYISFDNYNKYSTINYTVDEIKYDVGSISAGLEYFFQHSLLSPYAHLEIGYNTYSFHTVNLGYNRGFAGYYDTFDELPADYKSAPPFISQDDSYKISFGLGTNYRLSSAINLDVRYVFQINKILPNLNQFLVGINF